jgi:hypothetical protein
MRKENNKTKRPFKSFIFFGILSLGLYTLVFTYQDLIIQYFTKGKWYAALPIITAFVFSFVHGTFASNFFSILGIVPKVNKNFKKEESSD